VAVVLVILWAGGLTIEGSFMAVWEGPCFRSGNVLFPHQFVRTFRSGWTESIHCNFDLW